MKNKINKIKATWTYRHLSTITIVGLVFGIYLQSINFVENIANIFPQAQAEIIYTKEPTEQEHCFTACQVEQKTLRIFQENYNAHMEQARIDAIAELSRENEAELRELLFNSPYYDYETMREKYGE